MIILGIDPGSRKAGYAVIKVEGRKITYLSSGVIRYDHIVEFYKRPVVIYNSIIKLMDEFRPDTVSVESLVFVKNPSSLMKLAQARGAMLAAVGGKLCDNLFEYSPNLIKMSVAGHGHASKESVQKCLEMIFGKKIDFKAYDESDALAIALCHALNSRASSKQQIVKREQRL